MTEKHFVTLLESGSKAWSECGSVEIPPSSLSRLVNKSVELSREVSYGFVSLSEALSELSKFTQAEHCKFYALD